MDRIERKTFLALTFGMAACNTGPSPVVAGNAIEIPSQPAQPADAGAPKPIVAKHEPEPEAPPAPTDEDDVDELPPEEADNGCGFVDPTSVARPTAKCADDQGSAPACTAMKSCSLGFAFPKAKCGSYRTFYKPKVAQRAIDCLNKLSDKQVCDACNTYRCGDRALKMACPDPAADATCAAIVAKCRTVSLSECKLYLSGMTASGRAKMLQCLSASSGCGFGIYSCAESL